MAIDPNLIGVDSTERLRQASTMADVFIREARAQFSRLVARAEAGEEIVIRRRSSPVAKIVAYRIPKAPQRRPAALKGQITFAVGFDETPPDFAGYST